MADWTTIPDSSIEPGKPIRSIDGLALRDNPVAIAEGAAGAPRVNSDTAINFVGYGTGTVNQKNWILGRTSQANTGDIGTYAFLYHTTAVQQTPGSTVAGSSLRYANAYTDGNSLDGYGTVAATGTWRCMGHTAVFGGINVNLSDTQLRITLWLRIS
jgi:hypothetical protein